MKRVKCKKVVASIMRLPVDYSNFGHSVIELNQKCNIKCRGCYKNKSAYSKSLKQVIEELNHLCKIRKLDTITLAGGEPTLHPHLFTIIKNIKSRGVKVSILTNGVRVHNKKFFDGLKKSNADFVQMHIDTGQKRPDLNKNPSIVEVITLYQRLAKKLSKGDLSPGIAFTLYKKDIKEFYKFINFYLKDKDLGLITTFCYGANPNWEGIKKISKRVPLFKEFDYEHVKLSERLGHFGFSKEQIQNLLLKTKTLCEETNNLEVYNMMAASDIYPLWYLPSNISESYPKWLYYAVFVLFRKNGKVEIVSYRHNRFSKVVLPWFYKAYNLTHGCFPVIINFKKSFESYKFFIFHLLIDMISLNFYNFFKRTKFSVLSLLPSNKLFVKTLVFQENLRLDKKGRLVYCYGCPDATIRNGKLVQLCLADILCPINKNSKSIKYEGERGKLYNLLSKNYILR